MDATDETEGAAGTGGADGAGGTGGADGAGGTGAPGPGRGRPSRSARRIVGAVVVAAVVLVGLAVWVLVVPYRVEVEVEGFRGTFDCDAVVPWAADAAGRAARSGFEQACAEAEEDRRNVALLVGAGVAIAACAVSTVPSRRLTGEKLGPLR